MKKIKDPVLLGIIAGLTGNLLKNLGNLLNFKLGATQTTYPKIAGSLYLTKKQTATGLGKTVGWLADAVIGGGLGVGFVYVLKLTGKDHAFIKGLVYGHGAWMLLLGGANKLGASRIYPMDPKTVLSSYLNHSLYGIGAAWAATTLGDEEMFPQRGFETVPGQTDKSVPRLVRIRSKQDLPRRA